MASKDDRRYLESHEWHKLENGLIAVGVSQLAVDELTDITYLEITQTNGPIKAGESFGEIESVKTTSELYCGIDGEVVEVNEALLENPETLNQDPWDTGWMIKIRPSDPTQIQSLQSATDYDANQ